MVQKEIIVQEKADEALRENEEHYHTLFEEFHIPMSEEDFSEVKKYLDQLKAKCVTDLESYMKDHGEIISECAKLVKILDINDALLRLHSAKNKNEIIGHLTDVFTSESYDAFPRSCSRFGMANTSLKWIHH